MARPHARTNARIVKSELDRYMLEIDEDRSNPEAIGPEADAEAAAAADKELAWLKREAQDLRSRLAIVQGRRIDRSKSGGAAFHPWLKTISLLALTVAISRLVHRAGLRR